LPRLQQLHNGFVRTVTIERTARVAILIIPEAASKTRNWPVRFDPRYAAIRACNPLATEAIACHSTDLALEFARHPNVDAGSRTANHGAICKDCMHAVTSAPRPHESGSLPATSGFLALKRGIGSIVAVREVESSEASRCLVAFVLHSAAVNIGDSTILAPRAPLTVGTGTVSDSQRVGAEILLLHLDSSPLTDTLVVVLAVVEVAVMHVSGTTPAHPATRAPDLLDSPLLLDKFADRRESLVLPELLAAILS